MSDVRTVIVGDVHGCLVELDELLGAVALSPSDRLLFLGDLVDRGPDSLGVVRRVRSLVDGRPGSGVIMGNHEQKHLRNRAQGREPRGWARDAGEDVWRYLASLPLIWRLPAYGALLVHGGVFPRFLEHYGEVGDVSPTWLTDRGKRAERLRRFTRVRRVNAKGDFVALGQETPDDPHWCEVYDGAEGFVFFGHEPQLDPPKPLRAPHALGLDTGCCFGGRLTAAILTPDTLARDAAIVSVPAYEQYALPRLAREE